jgi:murein endopeptidase
MASMDDEELTGEGPEELSAEDVVELDDADIVDDEPAAAEGDGDPGAADEPAKKQRPAIGPMLLMLGCGGWLVWAVLHFGVERTSAPALAVAEERGDTDSLPQVVEPEPAIEEAKPAQPAEEAEEPALSPDETPWVESNWSEGIEAPQVVTYTVKRGGQLRNVANLFKIYHHEIEALNPGLKLDSALKPGSEIVVYRAKEGQSSASVGTPGRGSLEGAVPMMDGPGRSLKMIPWKSWGTAETVATLDRVLGEWRRRYPDAHPVLVGNLSSPAGGKLKPHASHQSGRDVDLSYPQHWDEKEELNWREMTNENLDREMTWNLLKLLVESGAVEHVFIDSTLQKLLYEWAKKNEPVPKRRLSRWLEYPRRPGTTGAIVQHVPGHTDHLHVRFACPPDHERCKSR